MYACVDLVQVTNQVWNSMRGQRKRRAGPANWGGRGTEPVGAQLEPTELVLSQKSDITCPIGAQLVPSCSPVDAQLVAVDQLGHQLDMNFMAPTRMKYEYYSDQLRISFPVCNSM